MARSRQMLATEMAEAVVAFTECGPDDQQCFYDRFDDLVRLAGEWKRLKLGDVDRAQGNYSNSGTGASKAAALKDVKRGSLRWEILKAFLDSELGLTKGELMNRVGRPHQTVTSAINDLMNGGWIRASGQEVDGQTVWVFASLEARTAAVEEWAM